MMIEIRGIARCGSPHCNLIFGTCGSDDGPVPVVPMSGTITTLCAAGMAWETIKSSLSCFRWTIRKDQLDH